MADFLGELTGVPLRRAFRLDAPCREFAPAGDLLFVSTKSRQKATPAKPPRRCASGCPAMLEARGQRQTPFAHCVRCGQTVALSQWLKRAAHAPRASALLGGLEGETPKPPTAQQPNSRSVNREGGALEVFRLTPLSAAEQRKDLRARAQRASSSDFARLSERSVAKRVPREPSRPEQRREPEAKRRAARSGGAFCLLFGGTKSRSPAGANSPLGLATKPTPPQARLTGNSEAHA